MRPLGTALGTVLGTALERPDAGSSHVGALGEDALETVLSSAPLDGRGNGGACRGKDPWSAGLEGAAARAPRWRSDRC